MSATTTPVFAATGQNLSIGGIIHSEWIKLRSIRSTWWIYAAIVAITVGVGAQMSSSTSFAWFDGEVAQTGQQYAGVNVINLSTDINVLIVGVLGVVVIAGEYSSGMIRSTLTAVPRRVPALLAKALVFAVVTFLIGAMAVAVTIPISIPLLAGNGIDIRLDDPHYWRAMIGSVGYLVMVGLMAFAIGAFLRNIASGIATALGLVFVVPLGLGLVAGGAASQVWLHNLVALLPFNLGRALTSHPGYAEFVAPGSPLNRAEGLWVLEPWQGALGLVVWVVVLFSVAIVTLKRRDA